MLEHDINRYMPPMSPPPFATADAVIAEALPTLRPADRIDVPRWAERDRRVSFTGYSGGWKNDFAPYMTEPASMVLSRKYRGLVFVGPARTVKSESLVLNTIGHAIACQPQEMLVVCQTQDSAKQFSLRKLRPMIRENECLSSRQHSGRGGDNLYEKAFAGGMNLFIGWPVMGSFSQNEYRTVILCDYDRYKTEDIEGEGNAFSLAMKRTQQAGSLGMTIAESSPGRPIIVDDWELKDIHEAPPCTGILAEFNNGTRACYYWTCPSCGDAFIPSFERLVYEAKGSPAARAATVEMVCPNGCCIAPDRKTAMNQSGQWLHESADGKSAVPVNDPQIRDTDIVSYRCEGPVAAMQSWHQLVMKYESAKGDFLRNNDETTLKATVTLDQGRAYQPAVRTVGENLSVDGLKALAVRAPLEIAPSSTRFLLVSVDVQGNRFVVQVDAFGDGLTRQLIDRFELVTPPDSSPNASGKRSIDPGRYPEDWDVLFDLLEKSYPVAESGFHLLPRGMIVDLRGAKGVTSNAYKFLTKAKKNGQGHRVFLANNQPGLQGDRAFYIEPEKRTGKKIKGRPPYKLVRIRTDMLKDEIALALTRKEDGPGTYRLPDALPPSVFEEFCAEQRTEKGWSLIKSGTRNEALDLAVYGLGLAIILGAEKIDWARPPQWADVVARNNYAVQVAAKDEPPAPPHVVPPARRRRRVLSKGI
tara:strand:+ start:12384 stop:14483 length:2100 start_codon:yes stop_codon:yes gene_type:complete